MKKNVYLTVLTVVTVLCIIAGSCYHIIGWGTSLSDGWGIPIFSLNGEKEDAGSMISRQDQPLDNFTSIDADVHVMSLTLKPGKAASISYKCNARLEPKYEVENDTLYITQNSVNNIFGNKKCSVTLTLPADVYYDALTLLADVGDLNIDSIKGKSLHLDADVGDINLDSCEFESLELIADVGDINIEQADVNTLDISADVGDVDIKDSNFMQLTVENSVGNIDVESNTDLSDYNIDMETSIGDVKVNGADHKRSFSQDGTDRGKSVNLTNDTGDIDLKYSTHIISLISERSGTGASKRRRVRMWVEGCESSQILNYLLA